MLYSSEAGFFDANLVSLLEEVINDIAYALDALDREERQRQSEAALHPDDHAAAESRIAQALKERTTLDSDYRIVLPGGQIRWVNAVGIGVYDDQGRASQMIGICMDITERKLAERRRA